MLDWLCSHLADGLILNVGAGAGYDKRDAKKVLGIDLVIPETVPSTPFAMADATQLPFPDGVFDGAMAKDVIEHTFDPLAILAEVHRVCRPGGSIVLTVPRAIPRAVWDDATHVRGFTSRSLSTALTTTGWEVVRGPARIGGFPGAGRLGLESRLVELMRIPGFGHWFGTNWFVTARRN
jgi:SAM-dependent methyltransferase